MSDAPGAVFVDLDRTLIRSASGPVFHAAMVAEGVLATDRRLPGERYLYGFYNAFGETVPHMGLARAAARMMKGRPAASVRKAGTDAVEELIDLVQPWALEELAAHRAEGRLLVLATTSPHDLVDPLASALGFDDVIATRYQEIDGNFTGRLVGRFVWGTNKRDAAREWATARDIGLRTATPTRTASSTCPCSGPSGTPTP